MQNINLFLFVNPSMLAALRCRCLGSFQRKHYSTNALDKFCRNDTTSQKQTGPMYQLMNSLEKNETLHYLPQIVPNKTRCGNLDPVEMNETNKCYCLSRDKEGAGKNFLTFRQFFCR